MNKALHHTTLVILFSMILGMQCFGQKEKSLLRQGNKAYEKGDFKQAQAYYDQSLKVDPSFGKAQYNIGNTLYSLGDLGKAAEKFEIASADAIDKKDKAIAYHNQGNCYLNAGIYLENNPPEPDSTGNGGPNPQDLIKKSISAYKNALRNDPADEEARYNLAYAQKLIKQEGEGKGEGENEDQENQQEEQEEQENQDNKDGDEKDKQDQEQQSQDQSEEQEGEPEKKEGMTKKEAEQMLDALDKQEKDLQMKKGKERMDGEKIKIDKDW